jgi:urease accessory protein
VAEADLPPGALQKLMTWLSPSFPVGAYTYSHGLEWAIEDGTVTDAAGLRAWLGDILRHGAGRTDAILFCHAWRAAGADEHSRLADLADLGVAFQPSKERHLETTAQGRAFLSAVAATWPNQRLTALAAQFPTDRQIIPYPVAVAMAAAVHEVPLAAALPAFLTAFIANIVSAGVRAIPIGQTDGQRIVAALAPVVTDVANSAATASLDDLGGATLRADIASMKHETQYTRLFRS